MSHFLLGAAFLLLTAPLACRADTAAGSKAYLDRDFVSAFAEFTHAAEQGDVVAKRYLAIMHFQGQGTAKDEARGTKLAHECAQSGDLSCHLMYAESNLMGRGVRADFAEARTWARKAFAAGDARAGMTLAQAYLADPLNQYLVNGRADNARYDALARRTVQERAGQAEALDALAASAASGFTPARLLLSSVLYEQSGAGTAPRIIALLSGLPALPESQQRYLKVSQQVSNLGPTLAAPRLVIDAMNTVAANAAIQAARLGVKDVAQCKDFRVLKFLGSTPLESATWLPLKQPLVANTYPLTGTWSENWSVNLCGAVYTVKTKFDVDGMGGAYYSAWK